MHYLYEHACIFSTTSGCLHCETVSLICTNFFHGYSSVPEQVLTTQASVEAVISATTAREETKQSSAGEEGEPEAKRQNLGMDFSSLMKETVFDSQQVLHMFYRDRTAQLHIVNFWLFSIDPFHKLAAHCKFFYLTNLVFEFIAQNNFYSQMSLVRLIIYLKCILIQKNFRLAAIHEQGLYSFVNYHITAHTLGNLV